MLKTIKLTYFIRNKFTLKYFSSFPSHQVVGMPALSPTMSVGTISSWKKQPGDYVNSGDTIAEVETDKAVIAFDAVDEMYIAKHLVNAGSEVAVGAPIMITVDNKEDVDKFASYTIATTTAPTPKPVEKPVATPSSPPPPKVATPPPPPPTPVVPTPTPTSQPPKVATPAPTPTKPAPTPSSIPQTPWGTLIKKSPLASKLSLSQKEYITKYGSSLHEPVSS